MWVIIGASIGVLGFLLSVLNLWPGSWRPARISLASDPWEFGTEFEQPIGPIPLLKLRLPIVLRNDGARTGVVGAVRLDHVPDSWGCIDDEVFCHALCENIDPRNVGTVRFVQPVPVRGHETVVSICEFNLNGVAPAAVSADRYELAVSAPKRRRFWKRGQGDWRELGTFVLVISEHERKSFPLANAHFNDLRATEPGTRLRSGGAERRSQ